MKKSKYYKNRPLIITALVNVVLFVAVLFLMNYVRDLLNSDVKINLTEVVTQNRDVINSKLTLEINNLDLVSSQLTEYMKRDNNSDGETLKRIFQEFSEENISQKRVYVSDKEGKAYFSDGTSVDIAGRKYFRLAMDGNQNISDRLISRQDGTEIFVISVPVYYHSEVVGTVQKQYTPQEMYELCEISLFSSQGNMYIINSEGYILISSNHDEYSLEADNYFWFLYARGNQNQSKKLEEDIRENQAGFMETTIDGKSIFSAYTPIEEIHDWYLITSIATEAVSPNANIVIRMFYLILFSILMVFGFSMLYFLTYKNKQQANLEKIAFVDTVTQGNTYNKFMVDLREAFERDPIKQYYLLTFDIDNFKYVNSYYGFDYGDRILYQINQQIGGKLRPGETIARVSGDHFVVLLEEAGEERIRDFLDVKLNKDDITIYFTAGLYSISDPTENINLMVDKASTAKQASKGTLHKRIELYSEKYEQSMIQNEQMKRSVEMALDNDEMVPFFQPKVDVNSGKLVGAEALARWLTADGKLIPPFRFIPICEKTGMVVELDLAIFRKTLEFIHKNLEQGIECTPISVNFSRLHLMNDGFVDYLVEMLERYEVPPHLLELELTESVIFDNYETILKFTTHVHEHGMLVAMDDFGSGYSSLNMLKDIPIDILKIDKAFLDKTDNNQRQLVILSAIAQMADNLNIQVVVEGVETLENVDMMREIGCYIAQGYYFAKPMSEADFDKIYREGKLC